MISLKLQHQTQKRICITLAGVLVLCFIAYVYLVSASIVHVVMRTELNQEIRKVGSEISIMEGSYIAAQHKVSADIASLHGYTNTSKKIFIDRAAPSLALSNGDTR